MHRTTADPVRGALAGVLAGLVASLAMTGFQAGVAEMFPDALGGGGEPATEKAADKVSRAATGEDVPDDVKPAAGEAVHYGFGAALGAAYGIAAEYGDAVRTGGGTLFGAATALIADDIMVPALGLGGPPTETPPATHAYAIASHLVFGLVLEATRRLLRGR
ncbi:DUF1440 domain-containing protein [Glacieibacterium frigidum]|uniref:DUF1440 domain-containing protein n=1 Tax=Glacieibacterium frigidum TaxID=2593303 RepID=A0A552U7M1_9SPHN|nr:DUF1440 domain-containing protein [Glacieibacterium frigidum]TRW14210.1 DUF1440 domain-containing protein [Glacieibacterium frigidum]